jgi:hypothetical protein
MNLTTIRVFLGGHEWWELPHMKSHFISKCLLSLALFAGSFFILKVAKQL